MPDPPVPGTRRAAGSLLAAVPDLLPQLKRSAEQMRELDCEVVTEL